VSLGRAIICGLIAICLTRFLLRRDRRSTYSYVRYLACHKYFVLKAGLKTKAPLWRLLIHDASKFLPSEFAAYRTKYYGRRSGVSNAVVEEAYNAAWLKHIHRNPHHWEHWCKFHYGSNGGSITLVAYEMPQSLVREMVADWLGANRVINGKYQLMSWYFKGHEWHMKLHPATRELVEKLLYEIAKPLEDTK
jgi:hypothetical protein